VLTDPSARRAVRGPLKSQKSASAAEARLRRAAKRIQAGPSAAEPEAPAKVRGDRWWAIFNSPIVLFLLSSVVLTGISQRYAQSQADAAERTERRASFFKLFTELEYRVSRLEIDDDLLADLGPGDEAEIRKIGNHATQIITGAAPDGQSAPDYRNVYLGAILNQVELAAGLPANRELEPVAEALIVDDCQTAIVLHGELNVLRRWIELRHPLVDDGKLPKIPAQALSLRDQASLVMPDFDKLRSDPDPRWRQARDRLEAARPRCEDVTLDAGG
jgi:hypothetical protein